jgi:predicted ester cyclase
MRRYAFAYTAAHDFAACDDIMVEDYVLRMGPHVIRGRDEAYKPATERQYRQFPGLGFTVHDLLNNGDRCALRFTEHGQSVVRDAEAAWRGVSLYRWNGDRLIECRVEQDYYSRRRQLDSGQADPVPPPAADPWMVPVRPAEPEVEAIVQKWLEAGMLHDAPAGTLDDETVVGPCRGRLDLERVEVQDLLSAGPRAAFHVAFEGRYAGGLPGTAELIGRPAVLYIAGIAEVEDGQVARAEAVSDRLGLERRLKADAEE